MKIKFDMSKHTESVLEEGDLKSIEEAVDQKKEFILRMKEEFLNIPKDVREYFTAEMNVWNKIRGDKFYMASVFMMSPMVGGISLKHSEVGRPGKDSLLIGKINLDKKN